uniref:Uncharacterized protein n=1 Tax=Romanomermis culicivorax TaxID=13658 RepID=A0A915JQT2_ROMCU
MEPTIVYESSIESDIMANDNSFLVLFHQFATFIGRSFDRDEIIHSNQLIKRIFNSPFEGSSLISDPRSKEGRLTYQDFGAPLHA